MRVLYTAGPGDAFRTFAEWKAGRRDLISSHVPCSLLMMEACERHGASALITCTHEHGAEQSAGDISIVRRPDPSRGRSGCGYHLGLQQKARQNIRDALDFGADIAVIKDTSPANYARRLGSNGAAPRPRTVACAAGGRFYFRQPIN